MQYIASVYVHQSIYARIAIAFAFHAHTFYHGIHAQTITTFVCQDHTFTRTSTLTPCSSNRYLRRSIHNFLVSPQECMSVQGYQLIMLAGTFCRQKAQNRWPPQYFEHSVAKRTMICTSRKSQQYKTQRKLSILNVSQM